MFNYLINDSLYGNSIYLMLSTGIMASFGFFFWMVNTHLYSAQQIGIGTALISILTLISNFSLLGLGNSLIKFLPKSSKKNDNINTSFALVGLTAIIISLFYLIFLKTFSPDLLFVRDNIIFSFLFILFIAFASINTIIGNVFIAYRASKYVLIKSIIFSIAKLVLPFFLLSLGAYGIFTSMGIAIIIAFLFSLIILILRFNYFPKLLIDKIIIKRITNFSLGNYIDGFIGGLPEMVLPIILINLLGANFSAYFYLDMMIANIIYIIPRATSQSLFAEGSQNEVELKLNFKKAIKITYLFMIPAIILTFLFGKYILLAFGENYSNEGFILLNLLAISGIFISINDIGGTILKVKQRIRLLILISFIKTCIILILSIFFIMRNIFGLVGIGISWIIGLLITSIIYILIINKYL